MDLEIKIKAFLEGNGITLTDNQLQQLNATLKDTATSSGGVDTATKGTRASLREASMAGREFHEILGGIELAGQGGMRSISGVTMAVRGLLGALRGSLGASGVFGLVAIALGLIGGAFMALKSSGDEAGKGGDAAAKGLDKVKSAADLAKESLERFTKEALEAVNYQLEKISTNAKDAADRLHYLTAEYDKLRTDQLAHDIAKIEADETLTPAEQERKIFEARRQSEKDVFGKAQQARDTEIGLLNKEATEKAWTAQDQARQRREVDEELRRRKEDRGVLQEEMAKAQEPLESLRAFYGSKLEPADSEGAKKLQEAEDRARHAREAFQQNEEDIKTAEHRSQALTGSLEKANKDAAETKKNNDKKAAELEQQRKDAEDDFKTRQSTEAKEFNTKQREIVKKNQQEDDKLRKEYADEQRKAEAAEAPDDKGKGRPEAAEHSRARMAEIEKRRGEIAKEEGIRSQPIVQAEADNTAALKEVSGEIHALVGSLKDFNKAPPTPGSGGTMTTRDGRTVAVGPGEGTHGAGTFIREGETFHPQADHPGGGGTISFGGHEIKVGAGDAHAIQNILGQVSSSNAKTHEAIVDFAREATAVNDQTRRALDRLRDQQKNLRYETPPAQ